LRALLLTTPRSAASGCPALLPIAAVVGWLLVVLGLLLVIATPSRTAAIIGRLVVRGLVVGWLIAAAPSRAVAVLRGLVILGLLVSAPIAASLRAALGLGRGVALASFTGFVAVNVEHLFNFGILRVVLLWPDFDNKRDIVQLPGILNVEHADDVTNGGKLAVRNFNGLLVGMIKVQPVSAGCSSLRPVDNLQIQLKITAVIFRIRLYFRRINNDRVPTNGKPADALRRVELLCVKWLD